MFQTWIESENILCYIIVSTFETNDGSMEKTLVCCVTDYTTKVNLSVHIGLDTIKYILQWNKQCDFSPMDLQEREKSLFVKLVHALILQDELLHQ